MPVYSVDRRAFIPAADLQPGETLQLLGGVTQIESIHPLPGHHRVYNLEVHAQHVYHVTSAGVLVHNASPRNVHGGFLGEDDVIPRAIDWLGPDYTEIAPDVYRSSDDLRQFRWKEVDMFHPQPHVHFEAVGPDAREILENSHVDIPTLGPTP